MYDYLFSNVIKYTTIHTAISKIIFCPIPLKYFHYFVYWDVLKSKLMQQIWQDKTEQYSIIVLFCFLWKFLFQYFLFLKNIRPVTKRGSACSSSRPTFQQQSINSYWAVCHWQAVSFGCQWKLNANGAFWNLGSSINNPWRFGCVCCMLTILLSSTLPGAGFKWHISVEERLWG